MSDRDLSLHERVEDTRDQHSITVREFELEEIKSHFDTSLESIKKQFEIADELLQQGKIDEGKTIYRSQVVFLEGILDFYLHELTKYALYKMFKQEWTPSEKYKNFFVPMSEVEKALESSESKAWFFEYVNKRISRDVYLSAELMRDQLNLIGIAFPQAMAVAFPGRNEQESIKKGKMIIEALYKRRNEIAHQNDMSHESAEQNDIDKAFVEECITNIETIVNVIHNIALSK